LSTLGKDDIRRAEMAAEDILGDRGRPISLAEIKEAVKQAVTAEATLEPSQRLKLASELPHRIEAKHRWAEQEADLRAHLAQEARTQHDIARSRLAGE